MAEIFATVYQGAGGRIDLGYDYTQNIENNSTTLTVKAYVVKTNSSYYSYRQSAINFKLTVNGIDTNHSWTFDFRNMNLNQRYLITTATRTFTHSTDGTKSSVPASVYCATGTSGLGTISGSASIAIATIPRASQPSLNDTTVYMRDQTVTISTNRASSAFTHTLKYSFGGATGTIASGVGTSYAWTPPIALASQIPSADNGLGSIICETYNGSTLIGTKTVSIRLYVPADIKPSVAIGKSGVDLYQSQYVQDKSKVAVTLSASGTYGSTISSRLTTVKSGTNTISSSSSNSFTSGILTYSGTITIVTTVTDSRGRTASASTTISVVAYESARVVSFSAYRADSDGTPNPQGEYIKMTGTSLISSVNNTNTKNTVLRYREKGTTTWSNGPSDTTSYNPTLSAVVPADENKQYEVQIYMSDYFNNTQSVINIGTAFALMDVNATGKGIAFGKVSETDAMEINMDLYMKGTLLEDYVQSFRLTTKTGFPLGYPSDLNPLIEPGMYSSGSSTANAPNPYGVVLVYRRTTAHITQVFHSTWNNTFVRFSGDGGINWSDWKGLADSERAITESGSNSNGRYVKFGDGTMICYMTLTSVEGLGTYSLPASFIDGSYSFSARPRGTASSTTGGFLVIDGFVGSASTIRLKMLSVTATTINYLSGQAMMVICIGRWKA